MVVIIIDNNSYTRYRSISSLIHRIDPRIKLLDFLIIMISIFLAQDPSTLLVVFGFVFIISILARVKISSYFKTFYVVIPFFLLMSLIYIPVYHDVKNGFISTGMMAIRLYIFILLSVIFTTTTKEVEIANSIEWFIYPLKYIKVPVYEISMLITLTIRFIPLLIQDLSTIMLAQSSRGVNTKNGNFRERFIGIKNSFLPMFYISFKRADDISTAMTIRGYEIGQKRTKYYESKFFIIEVFSLLISISFFVTLILMNANVIDFGVFV